MVYFVNKWKNLHKTCLEVEKITFLFIHVRQQLDVINIAENITMPRLGLGMFQLFQAVSLTASSNCF